MDFGFTLKPDHTLERTIALTQQAEAGGFGYGWLFDSHVLWKDPYPLLTVMALQTTRLRLGTCVTNPATREPSVTASASRRSTSSATAGWSSASAAATRLGASMGKPPTTLARLEEATNLIRDLVEGRTVDQDGTDLHLTWTRGDKLPVWIAGYGPKALELTARIADGVILQLADPDLIRWFVGQLRGLRQGGRPRPERDQGHGRGAGARRRHGELPRTRPLVPGAGQQPRRRPGQQVRPQGPAARADRLRARSRGLRLPAPRRGRL